MDGHDPAAREERSTTTVLASASTRQTPKDVETQISSHLVRMIDFIFALVLGQGLLRFHSVVKDPFSANLQVVLALVLIYYTVVRSFIAWHISVETGHYKIASDERKTELLRVFMDLFVVVLYAYMLFAAEPLRDHPRSDIDALLLAFPMVFVLYLAWEVLRRMAWSESDDAELWVLGGFAVLYGMLLWAYGCLPSGIDPEMRNSAVLAVALVLMAAYRLISFRVTSSGH
jgi:hypothetical protein